MGRRAFRRNHDPTFQIRGATLCARSRPGADQLCQFFARAIRGRYQGRAGADRCRTDEDRDSFLRAGGFSKSETAKIIETVLGEENRKPESVFDFVQGITALARTKPHQDARLELEGKAKRLIERAI